MANFLENKYRGAFIQKTYDIVKPTNDTVVIQ
jgi:hypothetical protein